MLKRLASYFISVFGKDNANALYIRIIENKQIPLTKFQGILFIIFNIVVNIPGIKRKVYNLKKEYDNKIIGYNSDIINTSLCSIYDLPDVAVSDRRPRTINVLVPAFSISTISAGFFGVFHLAKYISSLGFNTRLVLFDNFHYDKEVFEKSLKHYPGLENLFDIMEIEYIGGRYKPLLVSEHDEVVATVWYSAYFAKKILEEINKNKPFLYLIQDYEAAFYPANSLFCLAHETYRMNYAAFVSTKPLFDFLEEKFNEFKEKARNNQAVYFNNACSARLDRKEDFIQMHKKKNKTFAFYSRPSVNRNMFDIGVLAIITAWREGIFQDGNNWKLFGMGIGNVEVHLDKENKLIQLPRMSLSEYENTIKGVDIALSLMASPHPSITPFDIAGIGGLVVTNSFENKDQKYFSNISSNIIVRKPFLYDLVDGIEKAISMIDLISERYDSAASINYPTSWEKVFS